MITNDELKTYIKQVTQHLTPAERNLLALLAALAHEKEDSINEFFLVLEEETKRRFDDIWGILDDAMREWAETHPREEGGGR